MSKNSQRIQNARFQGRWRSADRPRLSGRKTAKRVMRGNLTHRNASSVFSATIAENVRQKNLEIIKERQRVQRNQSGH